MEYCTYLKYYELTCLNIFSCHICPYWSKNVKAKYEEEEKKSLIKVSKKQTHKINKAETCKNYNCWCGKLDWISNCETCEFYEME